MNPRKDSAGRSNANSRYGLLSGEIAKRAFERVDATETSTAGRDIREPEGPRDCNCLLHNQLTCCPALVGLPSHIGPPPGRTK